jgi:hypothetical protein
VVGKLVAEQQVLAFGVERTADQAHLALAGRHPRKAFSTADRPAASSPMNVRR